MKGFSTSSVITMIIMLSFSLPICTGAEGPIATIEGISGNLKIQRRGIGEWEAAILNVPLYPGDKLRTDIDSYAALIYADGSQLKLNSNTLLKFQQLEAEGKRSLQLLFGEIWVLVIPRGRSFEVETPAAIAQVRGTEFDIMVFPEGRSILTVLEGKISFSNEYGSVIVETLERTKAEPGSPPTTPVRGGANIEWVKNLRNSLQQIFPPNYPTKTELERAFREFQYILTKDPGDASAHVGMGEAYEDRGEFDKAQEEYLNALEIDPQLPSAYKGLADIYDRKGEHKKAVRYYLKAINLYPQYAEAHLGLAASYYWQGDMDKAREELEETLKQKAKPETIKFAYWSLGNIERVKQNYEEAINFYNKVLELDPNFVDAHIVIATVYSIQGEVINAIYEYQEAIKLDPDNIEPYNSLGRIYRSMGKYEAARKIYEQLLDIVQSDSEKADIHLNLGRLYDALGKVEQAIEEYEHSLKLKPDNGLIYKLLGEDLYRLDRYQEAITNYQRAIFLDPKYAEAYGGLGEVYLARGELEKAEKELLKAIELAPSDSRYHSNLKEVYQKLGKEEEAQRESQIVEDLERQVLEELISPSTAWEYERLGLAYKSMRDEDKALESFQKSLELNPSNAEVHKYLGDIYSERKDEEKAKESYQRAIALNTNYADVYYSLGNIYRSERNLDKAIEAYKRAISLDPNNSLTYYSLASIYGDRGEVDLAIQELGKAILLSSEEDINTAWYHWYLGLMLEKKGELNKATTSYREAIELNPKEGGFHWSLAQAYLDQGEIDKAITEYNKAISLNPNDGSYHYFLALAYEKKNDLEAAIEELQISTELEEKNGNLEDAAISWGEIGRIWKLRGETDRAIQAYKKAISLVPQMRMQHSSLGYIYQDQGNLLDALQEFKTAVELPLDEFSDPVADYRSLALIYFQLGRAEEAIEAYNQALALDPNDGLSCLGIGIAYYENGQLEKAVEKLEKAAQIFEGDPTMEALAHGSLGDIYSLERALEMAKRSYKKALELIPSDGMYHFGLGTVYLREGDEKEAREKRNMATILFKERPETLIQSYQTLLSYRGEKLLNDYERLFQEVIKLEPANGIARMLLGAIEFNKGDYEKAKKQLELSLLIVSANPHLKDLIEGTLSQLKSYE